MFFNSERANAYYLRKDKDLNAYSLSAAAIREHQAKTSASIDHTHDGEAIADVKRRGSRPTSSISFRQSGPASVERDASATTTPLNSLPPRHAAANGSATATPRSGDPGTSSAGGTPRINRTLLYLDSLNRSRNASMTASLGRDEQASASGRSISQLPSTHQWTQWEAAEYPHPVVLTRDGNTDQQPLSQCCPSHKAAAASYHSSGAPPLAGTRYQNNSHTNEHKPPVPTTTLANVSGGKGGGTRPMTASLAEGNSRSAYSGIAHTSSGSDLLSGSRGTGSQVEGGGSITCPHRPVVDRLFDAKCRGVARLSPNLTLNQQQQQQRQHQHQQHLPVVISAATTRPVSPPSAGVTARSPRRASLPGGFRAASAQGSYDDSYGAMPILPNALQGTATTTATSLGMEAPLRELSAQPPCHDNSQSDAEVLTDEGVGQWVERMRRMVQDHRPDATDAADTQGEIPAFVLPSIWHIDITLSDILINPEDGGVETALALTTEEDLHHVRTVTCSAPTLPARQQVSTGERGYNVVVLQHVKAFINNIARTYTDYVPQGFLYFDPMFKQYVELTPETLPISQGRYRVVAFNALFPDPALAPHTHTSQGSQLPLPSDCAGAYSPLPTQPQGHQQQEAAMMMMMSPTLPHTSPSYTQPTSAQLAALPTPAPDSLHQRYPLPPSTRASPSAARQTSSSQGHSLELPAESKQQQQTTTPNPHTSSVTRRAEALPPAGTMPAPSQQSFAPPAHTYEKDEYTFHLRSNDDDYYTTLPKAKTTHTNTTPAMNLTQHCSESQVAEEPSLFTPPHKSHPTEEHDLASTDAHQEAFLDLPPPVYQAAVPEEEMPIVPEVDLQTVEAEDEADAVEELTEGERLLTEQTAQFPELHDNKASAAPVDKQPTEAVEEDAAPLEPAEEKPTEAVEEDAAPLGPAEEQPTEAVEEDAAPLEPAEEQPTETVEEDAAPLEPAEEQPTEAVEEDAAPLETAEEQSTEAVEEDAAPLEPAEEQPTEAVEEDAAPLEPAEEQSTEAVEEDAAPLETAEEQSTEAVEEDAAPLEPAEEQPTEAVEEDAAPLETAEEQPTEAVEEDAVPLEPAEEKPTEAVEEDAAPLEPAEEQSTEAVEEDAAPLETAEEQSTEAVEEDAAPLEPAEEQPTEAVEEDAAPLETAEEQSTEAVEEDAAPLETAEEQSTEAVEEDAAPLEPAEEQPTEAVEEDAAPLEPAEEQSTEAVEEDAAPLETAEEQPTEAVEEDAAPLEPAEEQPTEAVEEDAAPLEPAEEQPTETVEEDAAPLEPAEEQSTEAVEEDAAPLEPAEEQPTEAVEEDAAPLETAQESEAVAEVSSAEERSDGFSGSPVELDGTVVPSEERCVEAEADAADKNAAVLSSPSGVAEGLTRSLQKLGFVGRAWSFVVANYYAELDDVFTAEVSEALQLPRSAVQEVDYRNGSLMVDFYVLHPTSMSEADLRAQLTAYSYARLWELYVEKQRIRKQMLYDGKVVRDMTSLSSLEVVPPKPRSM